MEPTVANILYMSFVFGIAMACIVAMWAIPNKNQARLKLEGGVMAEHTPGPWHIDGKCIDALEIVGPDHDVDCYQWIALLYADSSEDVALANGKRIICACNAHDDLLTICAAQLDLLMCWHPRLPELDQRIKKVRDDSRVAIAKAKGE